MSGKRCARLPFEPLMRYSGAPTVSALSRRLNVARSIVQIASREGVTPHAGDRYAVALGTHPMLIWGVEFYADIDLQAVA